MGKPYALIGHIRFDKGEALRKVSLLSLTEPIKNHLHVADAFLMGEHDHM